MLDLCAPSAIRGIASTVGLLNDVFTFTAFPAVGSNGLRQTIDR